LNQALPRNSARLIFILFVVSGLTSLLYEITWSRILSTILGNTSLAVSIVVSIFMAGLALGSFVAARSGPVKRNALSVYAVLELGIGIYSLFTPRMAVWTDSLYAAAYPAVSESFLTSVILKAAIAAVLLLAPTIAMGATLPVLVKAFSPEDRQRRAALLYGINTAGAVAGTILAGYILIPGLGISRTIQITALCNFSISGLAFWGRSRITQVPRAVPKFKNFHPIYLLFLSSGFATLCYEILWTRALGMFFGSSVYAFSAILAAFLLGIASGSSYYSDRIREETDPFALYSMIQFRIALAGMFFLGVFMAIPFLLIILFQVFYKSFALFQVGQFLLIGSTIIYATFLFGATFPAALHFFRNRPEQIHILTGYVYGYSTIGSILGSLCAGFVLIPALGVERSLRLVVLLNLILGIFCFRRAERQDKRVLAIGGISLALVLFLPGWNRSIFNAGFYAFAYKYVPQSTQSPKSKVQSPGSKVAYAGLFSGPHNATELELLYYAEGLTATVAVSQEGKGIRSLLVNGKPDASNVATGDMRTQLLLGHLPVLFRGDVRDALVIGLGSGVTAGALSTHHPRRIDCVEIEEKVAAAARYFETENLDILNKKEFHLIVDDGRNFVQHASQTYDVITSEPSNLWMSGVANLFTAEFFRAARARLNPGGVMCQWIHLYQISLNDVLIFLKTFQSVFPHLSLWIDDSDLLVLGADHPLLIDPLTIADRMSEPDAAESLSRSSLTAENLLKKYAGDERIVQILRASFPLNTDDHPILEFSAPKSLFWDRSQAIARDIYTLKRIAETNIKQKD